MLLELKVAKALIKARKTIAIAESCSGGLLSHRLTNIPGSSKFLQLSLVNYSNESKTKLLHVPLATIKIFGAVSTQVALIMAKNVRKILNTDYGVALTGIAGPTGGSKRKPVGLTYIAISSKSESLCLQYMFQGDRLSVKKQATTHALKMLYEFLS